MATTYETVLEVIHYTDELFYFKTTRNPGFRFKDGEFVMMGLDHFSEKLQRNKPILRAYSIASPSHADYLEFYSIKVQDGPLTSKLQHVKVGEEILVGTKPVGTLVPDNVMSGRNLYMLSSGTGIAPFMSLARSIEIYENYDNVILVHGTRKIEDLVWKDMWLSLNEHEMYGELVQNKFHYYSTVSREAYENEGRVTTALFDHSIEDTLQLPHLDSEFDRVMICGSIPFNQDLQNHLLKKGFVEGNMSDPGTFVVERAFVG